MKVHTGPRGVSSQMGDGEADIDREAGGDEEEAEEQPAKGGDVGLDLISIFSLGEQDAREEGAESVGEA